MDFDRRAFIGSTGASALSLSTLGLMANPAFGQIQSPPDPNDVDGRRWCGVPDFAHILDNPDPSPDLVVGWRPERRLNRTPTVRLEAVQPDGSPIVIHNYGHSGAGVTLGLGCASLAEKWLASSQSVSGSSKIVIVGAGIIGLSVAYILKRRGYTDVTILTRAMSSGRFDRPATVSDIAGGQFDAAGIDDISGNILDSRADSQDRLYAVLTETLAVLTERRADRRDAFLIDGTDNLYVYTPVRNYTINPRAVPDALQQASRAVSANRILRTLIEERYGQVTPSADSETGVAAPFLQLQASRSTPELIRFGVRNTILINAANLISNIRRYLASVQDAPPVKILSGTNRTVMNFEELKAIDAKVVFNCAGLGAAVISGGDSGAVILGRYGLLVRVDRARGIDYGPNAPRYIYSGLGYMFPRSDGVVIGGAWDSTSERALSARQADQLLMSGRSPETYFSSLPRPTREDRRRARRMVRALGLFFQGRTAELNEMEGDLEEWASGMSHFDCAVDRARCEPG